jgi:hypothetical protein
MTHEEAIEKTDDIIERYEFWWRDDEALAEMKALWGEAINKHGVFIDREEETLFNRDYCRACISIGHAHGTYAYGASMDHPTSRFGHAPSILGAFYPSREEARTAAIESLIIRIPKREHIHEEANRLKWERMDDALKRLLRQPSLF